MNNVNKTDIVTYLNERIKYFTGGDEMKSMAESCTDEQIVKELEKVRNFITGDDKPIMRYVGVISNNIQSFLDWKIDMGFDKVTPHNMSRKFVIDNTFYLCLTQPDHVRGYRLDEITRTDGALRNKNFDNIVECCKVAMKPNGVWDI